MKRNGFLCSLISRNERYVLRDQEKIYFGRSCSVTYPLINKNVSNKQFLFQQNDNKQWLLTDLSSLNGTFVNGSRITPMKPYTLCEKDIIYFSGPYLFQYTTDFSFYDNWVQHNMMNDNYWYDYIKEIRNKIKNLSDIVPDDNTLINTSHSVSSLQSLNKKLKLDNGLTESKSSPNSSKCANHIPNHNYQKLISQLQAELLSKKSIIEIMIKESALKKEQFKTQKEELEKSLKTQHEHNIKELEDQISHLMKSQSNVVQELSSLQNTKAMLTSHLDTMQKTLNQSNKELNQKRVEVDKYMALKSKLEGELSKCNRENSEYKKRFDPTCLSEDKRLEERQTITAKIKHALENDFQCAICHETLVKATVLICSHMFCHACVETWLKTKRQCPVCRETFNTPRNRRSTFKCSVLGLDNFIDTMVEVMFDEESRGKRKELKLSHAKTSATLTSTLNEGANQNLGPTNSTSNEPSTSTTWPHDDSVLADYLNYALNGTQIEVSQGGRTTINIRNFGNSTTGSNNNIIINDNNNNHLFNSTRSRRSRNNQIIETAFGLNIPPSGASSINLTSTNRILRSSMQGNSEIFAVETLIPTANSLNRISNETIILDDDDESSSFDDGNESVGVTTRHSRRRRPVRTATDQPNVNSAISRVTRANVAGNSLPQLPIQRVISRHANMVGVNVRFTNAANTHNPTRR